MPRVTGFNDLAAISLFCSGLILAGCGGGSGAGDEGGSLDDIESPSSSEFSVLAVTPQDGSNGTTRLPVIDALFNHEVFGSSVNASSINLLVSGESVASEIRLDSSGERVMVVPQQQLLPLGLYSVVLKTSITDLSGNALADEYTWQFRVRDGAWGEAFAIENRSGTAGNVKLASGGNGAVTGIWSQDFGGRRVIWGSKFVAPQGWSIPEVLSSNDTESARFPALSVGSNGSSAAVWEQSSSTGYEIWANYYTPENGWQTPARISPAGVGNSPKVSIDAQGNAVAVWYQNDGTRFGIWSSHRFEGGSWTSPEQVDNGLGSAGFPSLGSFNNNSMTAVWIQDVDGSDRLYASEYVEGAGWDQPNLIHTATNRVTRGPVSVSTSENGTEVVGWTQQDNTARRVWSTHRDNGSNWETPAPINPNQAGNASSPRIAISEEGVAMAVWYQANGTLNNILASRWDGANWATPVEIDSNTEGGATNPAVAVDQFGNYLVTWNEVESGRSDIWSARYTSEAGWKSPVLIETDNAGDALGSDVVFDGLGNGVAVWMQFNGAAYDIKTNIFE